MIKKFVLTFFLCISPGILVAQEITEIAVTAISDAYAGVRRYCKKTTGSELANLNAYIIRNNGNLNARGLVQNCEIFLSQQQDSCDENHLTIDKSIPANIQCQAYIGTAMNAHNELVNKLTTPGTYVQPYAGTGTLGNHQGVYKIIGVVPGNSNDIYNVNMAGEIVKLPFQTKTPDMFINTDTNNALIGVHNHSVIYTQVDMTKAVSDMIQQSTGGPALYTLNSSGLSSHGDMDIKDSIGVELYQTPEQSADKTYGEAWAHTNGVLFEGKIVNFEWLGHYIFGARKGADIDTLEHAYDLMADNEQATTSGHTSGQSQTDSQFHKNVAEQARLKYNQQSINNTHPSKREIFINSTYVNEFANTQTNTEPDAYQIAKQYIFSVLENATDVQCWGKCKTTGNDTVSCSWHTKTLESGTTHFIFDDICNGEKNYLELPINRMFASEQTRTEYAATNKAEQYIKTHHASAVDLTCDGDCNLIGDDIIRCFFKENGVQYKQEFTFDDICN